MPYPIQEKLVIAVSSSALFDLSESDQVFREQGLEAYREHQRAQENIPLLEGVAFPLIKRLLSLNGEQEDDKPVEVILLSKNDPDTGLRVFNSIETHKLGISRAAFVNGRNPFPYMDSFNASLFLSANPKDVLEAVMHGSPAGQVLPTKYVDDPGDNELRIAFDFDGVIADDSAEAVFQAGNLKQFQKVEQEHGNEPMHGGPLARFFGEVARVQQHELARAKQDPAYQPRVRIAIVTARNAPAHKRLVTTLRQWGIQVDEVFFLGGIDKSRILSQFKPHIFFDDQASHCRGAAAVAPCAHVPFGVANAKLLAELVNARAANDEPA
jgi:5'-nucleotidase